MSPRSTHTFALLEVSKQTYEEIAEKLRTAGYDHAFLPSHDTIGVDMNGICLQVTREALAEKPTANELSVLVKDCPLGWVDGRIIRHRSTTDADVIVWLESLHRLAGVEV